MAEVLAKVCSVPEPWTVSTDPGGLLTITPSAPLLVQYSTGGSDTVPAGVAAAECPVAPAFVWVAYVVPGSGTLHVAKEADLPTLSGAWSALGHVYQHHVAPHQPGSVAGGTAALSLVISGEGCPIPTGDAGSVGVPAACTILSVTLLGDVSTTTVLDIQKTDYASYPSGASLVASAPPTITAALKSQDAVLSGWTTSLAAGDILLFSVSANDNATALTCMLLVSRP